MTRDPVEEVRVGYEILKALNIRQRGPDIIACPTCGRTEINLFDIVEKVEAEVHRLKTPIKIAIMGSTDPEKRGKLTSVSLEARASVFCSKKGK